RAACPRRLRCLVGSAHRLVGILPTSRDLWPDLAHKCRSTVRNLAFDAVGRNPITSPIEWMGRFVVDENHSAWFPGCWSLRTQAVQSSAARAGWERNSGVPRP